MKKSSARSQKGQSENRGASKKRRADRATLADRRRTASPLRLELLEDRSLLSVGVATTSVLAASVDSAAVLAATVHSGSSMVAADAASDVSISSPSINAGTSANKTTITWSVAAVNGIGATTLTIDGVTVSISKSTIDRNDANFTYSGKLAAGTHSYAITATDLLGDSNSSVGTFRVAATTPTITGLAAKATKSDKAATITWNVNDIDGIGSVVLTIDGVAASGVKTSGSGTSARFTFSGKLTAGTHVYSVAVTDSQGQSATAGGVVAVAGTTPTIGRVKVSASSSLNLTTIRWTVTDVDGVSTSTLMIDGVAVSSSDVARSDSGSTASFVYSGAVLGGKHSYTIVATDSVGLVSKTVRGSFSVKATAPTISGVNVVNTTSPISTSIQWSAYDIDGIGAVTLTIDGRSVAVTRTSGDAYSAGYSYNGVLSGKKHTYVIKVVDVAGMAVQSTGTFTVAAATPTISGVVVSSMTSNVPTTIVWNVNDVSGIANTILTINGAAATVTQTSGNNYSASYSYSAFLPAGTYAYKITTINAQGVSATAGGSFTVVKMVAAAPSVSSISVSAATSADAATIAWNVTAPNGIADVALAINHKKATITKTSGNNYSADYCYCEMLPVGAYSYVITATDTQGKTTTAQGIFTVASPQAPVSPKISNITVAGRTTDAATTITWNVADENGIQDVALTLNGESVTVTKTSGTDYSASYSYSAVLDAGSYTFSISATDPQNVTTTFNGAFVVTTPSSTSPSEYTTSSNWSGYAVNTDLSNPASNSVTYVTGSWNVPSVSGNSTGYCAVWVGIDGMGSQTVEQIGTGSDVENGVVHYYAWYEMYPDYMIPISTLTISAGDAITASVRYLTSGSYSGMFLLTISDDTTGQSFSIYQTLATAERLSAEWIVEVPSSDAGLLTLADFSPVTFTNAQATVNGVTGAIDSSSWENAQIDLVSYYGSSVLASTSALTDLASGSSFTVTRTSVAASTLATSTSLLSQGVGSLVALAAAPMDSTATPAWLAGDQGDGVSSSVSSDGETESAGDASAAVDASGLVLPNAAGTTNAANSRNGAKPQRLVAGAGTTTPWALLSSDLGETVKSLWLVDYGCLSAGFLADADAVDRVFSA